MVVRTERAQGEIGLRSQNEHEEGVLERHVATQEAQPDGDRDECDGNGRQELKDQGGKEGEPQRRQRGRAVAVGDGSDGAGPGLGPSEDLEGGHSLYDVEEVPGEALQRRMRIIVDPAGRSDQRHEERDQREADRDERSTDPIGAGDDTDEATGTMTARNSWGRYRAK